MTTKELSAMQTIQTSIKRGDDFLRSRGINVFSCNYYAPLSNGYELIYTLGDAMIRLKNIEGEGISCHGRQRVMIETV